MIATFQLSSASTLPTNLTANLDFDQQPQPSVLTYSRFASCRDTIPESISETFDALANRCREPVVRDKKDGPAFCPATFTPAHRNAANAKDCSLLAFDLDNLPDDINAEDVLDCVEGIRAFTYSTHSHKLPDKGNRFRVVIAIDKPIPSSKYKAVAGAFAARFESLSGKVDTAGYCRVSTSDQTTDNQVQEIAAAGFTVSKQRIIAETISGSVAANMRKGFSKLLDKLEAGDVLIVTKLDRLGRNAIDVRTSVERLDELGVRVHCLQLGGVDLTSPAGRMTMQVINAVAEFERDLLIERTNAGIKRAKSEGKTFGRPSALDAAQQIVVAQKLANGIPVAQIARDHKTSRQTIMRLRSVQV